MEGMKETVLLFFYLSSNCVIYAHTQLVYILSILCVLLYVLLLFYSGAWFSLLVVNAFHKSNIYILQEEVVPPLGDL